MTELTHTALLPGVPVGPLYQLTQALCKRSPVPPMPCFLLIAPLGTRKDLRFTLVPQTKCPLIKEGAVNPQHCTKPMELGYWLSSGSQERRPLAKSLKPPLVLKVFLQPASEGHYLWPTFSCTSHMAVSQCLKGSPLLPQLGSYLSEQPTSSTTAPQVWNGLLTSPLPPAAQPSCCHRSLCFLCTAPCPKLLHLSQAFIVG